MILIEIIPYILHGPYWVSNIALNITVQPVSINDRYIIGKKGNKRILILSNEYRNAKDEISLQASSQWSNGVSKFNVWLDIKIPKGRSDIDAYIKIILDALQGVVYENDRQVKKLSVEII